MCVSVCELLVFVLCEREPGHTAAVPGDQQPPQYRLPGLSVLLPVPPSIENPQQETIDGAAGNLLILTCNAVGMPPPAITWLKDGSPLGMGAVPLLWWAQWEGWVLNTVRAARSSQGQGVAPVLLSSVFSSCSNLEPVFEPHHASVPHFQTGDVVVSRFIVGEFFL